MFTEAQLQRIEDNFRTAAEEFDFTFQRPFALGNGIAVFGHISNYGSKNGTAILLMSLSDDETRKAAFAWCEAHQMFCSSLNPAFLTGEYRRSYFREMLRDWGRFEHDPIEK